MDANLVFWLVVIVIELVVVVVGIRWIVNKGLPNSYSGFVPADAAIYSLGLAVVMIATFLIIVAFVYLTGLVDKYHLVINPITKDGLQW